MFLSRRAIESAGPLQALSVADPDERVEAMGFQIGVRCWGHGRPVVCLHDVGSGSRDFEDFAALAADRFEVIALDWPGHGWSPCDGLAPDPERWAEVLLATIDALHLDRPLLIAQGFAAAPALLASAEVGREGVSGLALCNPWGLAAIQRSASWRDRLVVEPHSWRVGADRLGRQLRLAQAEEDTVHMIRDARCALARAQPQVQAAIGGLAQPVWFAWTAGDAAYPLEASRTAARRVSGRSEHGFEGDEPPYVARTGEFLRAFADFADGI